MRTNSQQVPKVCVSQTQKGVGGAKGCQFNIFYDGMMKLNQNVLGQQLSIKKLEDPNANRA
jgi:hypothetical protein